MFLTTAITGCGLLIIFVAGFVVAVYTKYGWTGVGIVLSVFLLAVGFSGLNSKNSDLDFPKGI